VTTPRRALFALVAALVLVPGCGQGLLFSQDRRIEIVSPARNGKVTLPFVVRWTVDRDVVIGRDVGSFAVFFDSEPQPPDATLASLAKRDTVCKQTPGCPDRKYYEQRGIFVTTDTHLDVPTLYPVAGVDLDKGDHDRHDVTIVVLDAQGRRMTEASWSQLFEIEHPELDT
jgi:hypothetical protein